MRSLATGTVETCRRHGNGTVSVRLSVRLSVPSVDRCSSVRRVCCCGPGEREISIDCCTAGAQQQRRRILDFYRAVLAMGLCLCVSVYPCVTSRSSAKTAKRRITQTTPHDSPGNLVF